MISRTSVLPLDLLQRDEQARIVDVAGSAESVHRLDEMGVRPGVVIRLIRPGSPCILTVGETRLSLRPAEGSSILVEPLQG